MQQTPYVERRPAAVLLPWIETYWVFTVAASIAAGIAHRVLPDLASDIIFDVGVTPVPSFGGAQARVIGAMTTAKISAMVPGSTLLGVRFRPHASAAMLKMPASEIKNQDPSIVDLGLRHVPIHDRLVEFACMDARFQYLDQVFLAIVRGIEPPNPALLRALALVKTSNGRVTVEALAAATNQSRRHLTRIFANETGLTTKEFLRITRLRSCLPHIENLAVKPDWAELAYQHGFYDQAHFTNEFGQIVGLTPHAFWIETKLKRGV